ncbi:hypothetical protein GCM10027598_05450 [Amycolatopsis oliviviridis]|uniref:Uncharacterized protein n=1 Tax=Amycolatopsis oliviviridis TaxID=1471590 RepID=A0ABQ3LLA9_9PSEU|nr:hypothetical protein GCM10017790_38850 [Amycolatopsis oliviviridis]
MAGIPQAVRLISDIGDHGYHKVGVFSEDADEPDFSYTTGLEHSLGHPEFLVVGLEISTEFAIIDNLVALVRAGAEFGNMSRSDSVLEGKKVCFRSLAKNLYSEYVQQAVNFYRGEDFSVLVVCLPDENGLFPSGPPIADDHEF